jgi:hypothetical protein
MITLALLLLSVQMPYFPGAQPLPNPKPEDRVIIAIPATRPIDTDPVRTA